MKRASTLMAALAIGFGLIATAQPPMDIPEPGDLPPPGELADPGMDAPPIPAGEAEFTPPCPPPHGGRGPSPHMEKWMERLREKYPAEFEKLARLRSEDPEAFKQAIQKRLRQERVHSILKRHPELNTCLEGLAPQQREDFLAGIGELAEAGPGERHRGPPGTPDPAMLRVSENMLKLSRAFRASTDPAEKETIRNELRSRTAEMFDLREKQRREQIAAIERDLVQLKASTEKRQANRDAIIERRVSELTGEDPLKW